MVIVDSGTAYATTVAVIEQAGRWLRLALETTAAAFLAVGAAAALTRIVARVVRGDGTAFTADRLVLARFLAWALEFQLAADILDTAMEPEWQKIGQLAAIAAIRTALNFTLTRELNDERERLDRSARKSNTSDAASA